MAEELIEFRVSNDAFDDAEELRRRIAEDGYLFFKRMQDPDMLLQLRRQILEVIRDGGWIQAGTDLIDGIADISRRCTESDHEYTDVYHKMYRLESFHRAGHWPAVLDMIAKVIGGPVLPHPSKVARIWFPRYTDHTTPAHQDFVHFQGSYETYTCWTPLGDCPVELGGLAVLPGSHKKNTVFDHHFSLGAGDLTVDTGQHQEPWATTDYEVGDSLVFHSLTLHRALPNVTPDRLRISLDNRYQGLDVPIAEHQLEPHMAAFSALPWDVVYADWKSTDLRYYWRDLPIEVVPRDRTFVEHGFAEALSLAEKGDPGARLHLARLVRGDPQSEQGKAAEKVLSALDAEGGTAAQQPVTGD